MNCNWETRDLLLPTKNPSKMPCFLALNKRLVKTSTTMIKRKGESLSPCLNPLEALTRYLAQPFSQRTKFTEDQQPLIQCLNLEFSLFFLKHGMKNPDKHDRRKYFFFLRKYSSNQPWKPCLLHLSTFSHPLLRLPLRLIWFPSEKSPCEIWIVSCNNTLQMQRDEPLAIIL